MKKILELISCISIRSATLLLVLNVCVVMYGVITRYIVGGAPIWTDELARYTMIATAMFAMAGVWVQGEHMRVSLAERFLPAHLARMVILYQWLLALILSVAGAWLSWHYAQSVSMFRSQGLGISRSILMLSMPAGFALLAVAVLLRGPKALPQQTGG